MEEVAAVRGTTNVYRIIQNSCILLLCNEGQLIQSISIMTKRFSPNTLCAIGDSRTDRDMRDTHFYTHTAGKWLLLLNVEK